MDEPTPVEEPAPSAVDRLRTLAAECRYRYGITGTYTLILPDGGGPVLVEEVAS